MGWLLQNIKDDDEDDVVTAQFVKRTTQVEEETSTMTLTGCLLVGTDGVNSSVRDFLGLPKAKKTSVTCWRGRLQIEMNEDKEQEENSIIEKEEKKNSTNNDNNNDDDTNILTRKMASDILRPLLVNPVMATGFRFHGPMNYILFNFHPKLVGTLALVVNYQQTQDFEPGASPQGLMEECVQDNEQELKEVQAIARLVDQDGMHNPLRMKVIELPKENDHGWGGKGRITLTGDAAHGKLEMTTLIWCCYRT